MIQLHLRLTSPTADRQDVLDTLQSVIGPTEVKPGCEGSCVCQDVSDPSTLIYMEEWESQEAFETHILSEHFWKILSAMDLSTIPPQIRINTIVEQFGIEYIAAVRGLEAS